MPDFTEKRYKVLLCCHGIADMYGYSYGQHNANFAEFRRHTLPFRQYFSIGMALHPPQPHSWCWFCHSFGRFNCLLFQILHPRNAAIHAIPTPAPPRREIAQPPPPVPMYVRSGTRTLDPVPTPVTVPAAVTAAPPPAYPKYWEYQPVPAASGTGGCAVGGTTHAKQHPEDPDPTVGNVSAKKSETIGYYQLEIRQNVVNIPPNLNRFIPYHIPDANKASRGSAEDSSKSFAKDTNYCDFPPLRRHGTSHSLNSAGNGQGTTLYF